MNKPVLLLDMDGPLADFDKACWDWAARHGYPLDIEHPWEQTARFFTDHLTGRTPSGLPHSKLLRHCINNHPTWFYDLEVTPGAQTGVAVLEQLWDVWVCTKPLEANANCRDDKGRWLRKHFPTLEKKLLIVPDKSLVKGAVLLDDAIKITWLDRAEWQPVVFTRPYNGKGSVWENMPHWDWESPISDLNRLADLRSARWDLPA